MNNKPFILLRILVRLLASCWLWIVAVACRVAPISIPTQTAPPIAASEIAVITQVLGKVVLQDIDGNMHTAQAFQTLTEGSRLRLADNAQVTVICFQNQVILFNNPGEVEVTQHLCATGMQLPTALVQRIKPDAGRLILLESSLALEEAARERESDYGNIPIILSPRNTSLLDLMPTVQWVAVPDAIEYQLSLNGLSVFDDIVLKTTEVSCTNESGMVANHICTVAWPSKWMLEPGQRYFLTIGARMNIASPLRESSASALRTLHFEQANEVQNVVNSIQLLNIDDITREVLFAALYAENKLYIQAITAYKQIAATQSAPILYVTLGDLYRMIDLQRYAFYAYQYALDLLGQDEDDVAVRGAAEFGIGQVYYAQQNFDEAEKHYTQAVELYRQINAEEELRAAEVAMAGSTAH